MTFTTSNMVSQNTIININDELKFLNNLFESNGWQIGTTNKSSEDITYSKQGSETEFFKIELNNNYIYVSVPLKNSSFQYKTKFDNYYSAIKYTESKFYYFVNDENTAYFDSK